MEFSPLAPLERLLTPVIADAVAIWSVQEGGGCVRMAGAAAMGPPEAAPDGHDLLRMEPEGRWIPADPEEGGGDARTVAVRLRTGAAWLVAERVGRRPAFDAADLERLREAAALAAEALERTRLADRLLEARAAGDAAAHRWSTVARVSRELARVVEFRDTIEVALGSVVPYLADCAILDVVGPEGPLRVARHLYEERGTDTDELDRFPFGEEGPPEGPARLPAEGLCIVRFDDEAAERLAPADERPRVRALGICSLASVPLPVGDRPGGALTLVSSESGQVYGPNDLDLFRQIGLQIGLALNAAITVSELRRARREREEVLAIVSHDLKNPLNVLRFAASLLLTPGIDVERKQGQFPVIERAVDQMDALIDNLLDASRIDAGRFSVQPVPLEAEELVRVAADQMRPLAEREGVELVHQAEPGLPPVAADRERLLRVFDNLLSNAISFSSHGGRVEVRARRAPHAVCFEVCDDGPGIEREVLEHIFDRFWQAQRQGRAGAGLGLTIARGIVVAHGGSIDVESELGAGTTFRFTIPYAALAAARSAETEYTANEENDDS